MSRQEGLQGEALVADYLRKNGFKLVAHGYFCRFGEIDLIAWEGIPSALSGQDTHQC